MAGVGPCHLFGYCAAAFLLGQDYVWIQMSRPAVRLGDASIAERRRRIHFFISGWMRVTRSCGTLSQISRNLK